MNAQYRREAGHLYELKNGAYVHCFHKPSLSKASTEKLVAAYHSHLDMNWCEE